MTDCLTTPEFFAFLEFVKRIATVLSETTVRLDTTGVGTVIWQYSTNEGVWCALTSYGV